jgi:hypothetical protein
MEPARNREISRHGAKPRKNTTVVCGSLLHRKRSATICSLGNISLKPSTSVTVCQCVRIHIYAAASLALASLNVSVTVSQRTVQRACAFSEGVWSIPRVTCLAKIRCERGFVALSGAQALDQAFVAGHQHTLAALSDILFTRWGGFKEGNA